MSGDGEEAKFLDKALGAYDELLSEFGYSPVVAPGRRKVLGWDVEYICGSALATFVDQICVRRLNDFTADSDCPRIIDCGANIGISVLNYLRQYPKARITAIEADPSFIPILRRNLDRNGGRNVELIAAAAWICDGQARWRSEGIDGSHVVEGPGKEPGLISVPAVDLARLLGEEIDLLKLDIEGGEYRVVPHVRRRLRNVKNLVVECHFNQATLVPFARLLETLADSGFRVSVNTFGAWRDLLRQTPVLIDHWEQYLLVAGWRGSLEAASTTETSIPYSGAKDENILRSARASVRDLQEKLDATKAELGRMQGTASRRAGWQGKWLADVPRHVIRRAVLSEREVRGPFTNQAGRCWTAELPALASRADNDDEPDRSDLLLFEDDVPLGPAHVAHEYIRSLGRGRYSHWKTSLYFSTSDGSDPNENGRKYTILFFEGDRGEATDNGEP